MLGNLLRLIHNDSDNGCGFFEEVLAHQHHGRLGAAKLPVDTRFVRRVQQVEEAA